MSERGKARERERETDLGEDIHTHFNSYLPSLEMKKCKSDQGLPKWKLNLLNKVQWTLSHFSLTFSNAAAMARGYLLHV